MIAFVGDTPDAIAAELRGLSPLYAPTPLLGLPNLAARLGVAQVLAKDEGQRALGSFKSLGGTYAGLRALAGYAPPLPALVCASDGNHGLAVAAAAQFAGTAARVYLHGNVPPIRAGRIAALGAEIVWVQGTYDDAVDAASRAARDGAGLLIADTGDDPNDPVVRDVMAGYGVMAAEIREQVEAGCQAQPTHVFVQAGVGGLAAAMAQGLAQWLAAPAMTVVVEPDRAACVGAALRAGRPVRLTGDLDTEAEMLSCGESSAPALAVLRRHGAVGIAVTEASLSAAPGVLRACGGPGTTPSGAAGLAGALTVLADPALAVQWHLGPQSRVLLLVTEAALDDAAT